MGAQIQTSTVTLRSDIQNILNDIGKRNPPKITVGLAKTATKTKLTTDLNDLLTKQSIGITLGLKGGGSLRGSSGAKITKELIDITSQLSQHQVAKITLHLNTAATQKAMLAELKKLDLNVNITPRQQQKQAVQPVVAKYGPAMPASSYAPATSDYTQAGAAAKDIAFRVQAASDASALLRQNLNQAAKEAVPDYSKFQGQVGNVVDNLGQMWNGQHQQALTEYNKALQQAKSWLSDIYQLQQKQLSVNADPRGEMKQYGTENETLRPDAVAKNLEQWKTYEEQIRDRHQRIKALEEQFSQSQHGQVLGVTTNQFESDLRNFSQVEKAAEKVLSIMAKIRDGKVSAGLLKQGQTLRASFNTATQAGIDFQNRLDAIEKEYLDGTISADQYVAKLNDLRAAAKKAGAMAESAGQKFNRMLGEKIGYGAIALLLAKVRQALGEVYTSVVNIDAAMTELKKVTDETASAYDKFLSQSGAKARELGSTVTDVVNATAGFARLGYNLTDSAELAETAIVYNNVGDGIASIDDATESVISTMQAFNITAQDSMSIADKFNQIGNKFAISSGGVGEAMQRSASAMEAAGNTLDETLALIAAANTVVQNPESVGTSLKTISMYLRAAKTEAEEAGESTDGMAESVSKLREEIKALTGNKVDIMQDDQTFKSTYQILKELSQVWNQISDVSQANILERLAGKRNSNVVSALLNNFDIAEKALVESQNAAGSAMAENEKYLDSINGKLNQLKASWEQLSNSLLNSGLLKGLIDGLRMVLDFFNNLDAATNGWSSKLISLAAVFAMFKAVVSAFTFKAQDKTSMIAALLNAFSSKNILQINSVTGVLTNLKTTILGLYSVLTTGKTATGAFTGGLNALVAAVNPVVRTILIATAVIGGLYAVCKAFSPPSLSDLQKDFEESKARADELKASLEANNTRLDELRSKLKDGGLAFVEQDELDRLEAATQQLQAQYDVAQKLADVDEAKVTQKTADEAGYYFNALDTYDSFAGQPVEITDYHKAQQALEAYQEAERQYNEEASKEDPNTNKLRKFKQAMDDNYAIVTASQKQTSEWLTELNKAPEANAEVINQCNQWLDTIYLAIGGADALATIWNRFWNDDTAHAGITKVRDAFTEAANAQAEYNEELKKYGSNVDLTARPHVTVTQDMVDTGLWRQEDLGQYSTVNSMTFLAKDFGNKKSTQTVLVTPILPDGTYFDSQYALEDYISSLIDSKTGEIDVSKDTKGIVMGVFDEGDLDASIEKAEQVGEAAHNANAAFHDLMESDAFQTFREELEAVGIDISKLTAEDLAKMFENIQPAVEPATESLKGLAEALATLEAKGALLKSSQEELSSSGALSSATLSSVVDKFPALEESVSLYIAGMKTGKELISDLSAAYAKDAESYKSSMATKLANSEEFFKKLPSNQKKLITDLADSYHVDLGNFKTVEQAKLNFQAEIIKKLAINYRQYSGMTLEQLKDQRKQMNIIAANADLYRSTHGSAFVDSTLSQLAAVNQTIKSIEDGNARLDSLINTNLESWSPSKYSDKSGNKSGNKEDLHKKAAEEAIANLKHDYQIEKITAKQYYDGLEAIENRYYKNSTANCKTYASEIRSIDEELFSGRRQLAEDWLSDQEKLADKASTAGDYAGQQKILNSMLDKVKKMISDAYAYGLTEASDYVQELQDKLSTLQDDLLFAVQSPYEKYISYMDDFDLWDDIVKTGDAFSSMAGSIDQASGAVAKLSKQLRGLSKLDVLKQQLKDIDQLYKDGKLSWEKYVDAHNNVAKDIYDTQKDSLQTILDLTMEMIKQEAEDQVDAIEKQVEAYQKIIDLKKQLLQDTADEQDHEEQVAEKVKEIADLQSKIAQLSLDDSREAAAKRASLAEELQQKQKELADLQKDYALDQTIDALDKSQEAFEDEKDAEKKAAEESVDSWAKLYQKAIKRINGDWDGLYKDLQKYEEKHRDSIDGPNSLVTAWQSATSAMKEYNNNFEDAYNNAPNNALNPNAPNSPEAQAILKQMQENSNLAKAMGTSKVGGRDLHTENQTLANRYYELTGQQLTYDKTRGWLRDNANGDTAYDISTFKPSTSSQLKDTSSGGEAYKATVAKFKTPPTGTLKEGSSGDGVKWLQYYLKQLGLFPYAVDGQFYSRTKNALIAFQKMAGFSEKLQDGIYGSKTRAALPRFHTGGIVGNAGAINDHEVLALLKKGEWVLDDTRKQNLKNMFANLKVAASELMSSTVMSRTRTMQPAAVTNGGDTFAPHIEVNIQHNGQMTDKDAKQYGNVVASTALKQLRTAFVKRGKT